MVIYLLGFLLLGVAFLALALQRLYSSVPARELKRLAGRGDHLARSLYRVVAYDRSLRLFLWSVLGIALSVSFLLLIPVLPTAISLALLALVSMLSFVVLPSLQLTQHSARFAAWFVSPLVWILSHVQPILGRAADILGKHHTVVNHSRLYEKEDFEQLLSKQKEQADNRISPEDLELIQRSLAFGDRTAADILQPRKDAHIVSADETIGPVLLDQLHRDKQPSFLVYKDSAENIVGSLSMRDAVKAKHGGRVLDLVRYDLIFVHEDFSLPQVLEAFQRTGQQLVVVINSFEEFLGIITMHQLTGELLGTVDSSDEGLHYENRSAIAAYQPQPTTEVTMDETTDQPEASEADREADAAKPEEAKKSNTSSPEVTEVVE